MLAGLAKLRELNRISCQAVLFIRNCRMPKVFTRWTERQTWIDAVLQASQGIDVASDADSPPAKPLRHHDRQDQQHEGLNGPRHKSKVQPLGVLKSRNAIAARNALPARRGTARPKRADGKGNVPPAPQGRAQKPTRITSKNATPTQIDVQHKQEKPFPSTRSETASAQSSRAYNPRIQSQGAEGVLKQNTCLVNLSGNTPYFELADDCAPMAAAFCRVHKYPASSQKTTMQFFQRKLRADR